MKADSSPDRSVPGTSAGGTRSEHPPAALAATAIRCVHKFGGSSLADADMLRRVAALLLEQRAPDDNAPVWVVVSAMAGVTDTLTQLAEQAADGEWDAIALDALAQRHRRCLEDVFERQPPPPLCDWLDQRLALLQEHLRAIHTLESLTPDALARVQSLGEQFTAHVLSVLLSEQQQSSTWLDATAVLWIEGGDMGAQVDWQRSSEALNRWSEEHAQQWVVVTGFLARDGQGKPATLGRNGSDYSATIFARLLGAREVQIWTDVSGVLSADPRRVPEAVILPRLSYAEACELAYFGAKVIHPQSLTPAIQAGIPLRIRNTWQPHHPGTWIGPLPDDTGAGDGGASSHAVDSGSDETASSSPLQPVCGISSVDDLALLTVEGSGMIGVPGTAQRVFGALREAGVSVVMISQGSSEHSICCVVRANQAQAGQQALDREFQWERAAGALHRVQLQHGISVLAAVGDGMAGTPGIAARLFGALAQAQVNVRAIAQGSSERNISVAVDSAEVHKGLRAVHAGFWLSPQTVSVGIIGPGNVGGALIQQLAQTLPKLMQQRGLDIRVRAIANSKHMLLAERSLDLTLCRDQLSDVGRDLDWTTFHNHVQASHLPSAVIVDCSASDAVADHYASWLAAGLHVITPNKHAGSGPLARYRQIQNSRRQGGSFHYETTVGAGLPIIQTLRDLLDTGDEVLSIEGILSGTLAWLFNRYDGVMPFSQLVREAHAQGYTEPDPRDDLDGRDVARKLVILARELGHPLSLEHIQVESLVPGELADSSREMYLERLQEWDQAMAQRYRQAAADGRVLRYVARLEQDGTASVGLLALPADHDFARLRLTDNVVQFTTRRYRENPLIVRGPGAGREVTAAGVFADLLRVSSLQGAR